MMDSILKADLFIIPTAVRKIADFPHYIQDKYRESAKKILEVNGLTSANIDDELFVEVWATSNETLKSDNLSDHGFMVTLNGKRYKTRFYEWLPILLLKDRKEGDTIEAKFPLELVGDEYQEEGRICTIYSFRLTLAQCKYRYWKLGKFDQVLQNLISGYRGYGFYFFSNTYDDSPPTPY